MIETYLLEQLLAFYECGTLSAAADRLHLAQPSLSRSMQKLEGTLGVTLFDRRKNRIELNDTGILAAKHAKRLLDEEEAMVRRIRAFDRSLRTLSIGSCAPGPLIALLPRATGIYFDLTVSSAIDTEENLLKGLEHSEYSLIILPHPPEPGTLLCREYRSEQLFLSVNSFHPAASCRQVSFSELDGQSFIMYAHVGFWDNLVREKMPHSKFFLQNDMDAVGELARYSDLPSFSTDITLETMKSRQNGRINVPFADPDARATYYFIWQKKEQPKLKPLFDVI